MPILTVTGGATVREGEKAIFTVSLTSALTQDVWFRASTITSAGASSADGDYDAILDKLYFIPAGSKKSIYQFKPIMLELKMKDWKV